VLPIVLSSTPDDTNAWQFEQGRFKIAHRSDKRGIRTQRQHRAKVVLFLCLYALVVAVPAYLGWQLLFQPYRAAWVWTPERYFSAEGLQTLSTTAERWRLRTLFAQVAVAKDGTLANSTHWPAFLATMQRQKGRVYALAGEPDWSTATTSEPQRVIDAIANYNSANPPGFAGIQFDVEPHQLPQYAVQPREVEIQWLRFVSETARYANDRKLQVGFAIPWFLSEQVMFDGQRAPVYQHAMSHADHVAVMAYRTELHGPDGVTSLTQFTRAYSKRNTKVARTYLGIELTSGTQQQYRFLASVAPPGNVAALQPEYNGRTVKLVQAGRFYLLGLSLRPLASDDLTSHLLALASAAQLDITAEPDVLNGAARELQNLGEWAQSSIEELGVAYNQPVRAIDAQEQVPQRITFAGRSDAELRGYIYQVEKNLVDRRNVLGVAIHDLPALEQRQ